MTLRTRPSFLRPGALLAFVVLVLTLSACVIGVDTPSNQGVTSNAPASVDVELRVESSGGEASLQSVRYQVGSQSRTIDGARLPWSTRVRANVGDTIVLSADASAARGATVTIRYQVFRDGRVVAQGSRSCDQIGCPGLQLTGRIPR